MSKKRIVYYERESSKQIESHLWPIATRALHTELLPILNLLHDKNMSQEIRACLKKYIIIFMVSTIERFLWNAAVRNIDIYEADISDLIEGTLTIPLSVLDTIAKGRVTRGKIIASNFNFANPSEIKSFFSKMLKIDFYEIIKAMDKNDPYNYVKRAANLNRNWKNFISMFELRNRIVHDKESVRLSTSQLRSLVNCTMNFLDACVVVSDLEWRPDLMRKIGRLMQKGLLPTNTITHVKSEKMNTLI